MFLIVPFVALCGFAGCLVATIILKIRIARSARTAEAPSPTLAWWYRSLGQMTLVWFFFFCVTRLYYLL